MIWIVFCKTKTKPKPKICCSLNLSLLEGLKKSTTSSSSSINSDNCDYANEIKDKEYI